MTEHLNIGPECQFIDKTVSRVGCKEWESGDVKCRWNLYSLPEYVGSDETLSLEVIEEIMPVLIERGWKDVTIGLIEGYSDEDAGKEHYRLVMVFGEGSEDKKFTYLKEYSAVTEHGEVNGGVRSTIGLSGGSEDDHFDVEKMVADIYIRRVEVTYPDWQNQWSEGHFVAAR